MINLLNPADIKELSAARVNVRLRLFTFLTFLGVGIIGLIYAASFKIADTQYDSAVAKSTATNERLSKYAATKTTAQQYQTNLTIAKKILGSEITFSTFITNLAASLPASTILDSVTLSTQSIGAVNGKPTETSLTAKAKSYSDVLALKTNLEKKTDLFSAVRITSTTLSSGDNKNALLNTYPYTVTFSVVLANQGATQ